MLIAVPAGYVLTSSNRLVPGGPCCIGLGAGLTMDSTGRITPGGPSCIGLGAGLTMDSSGRIYDSMPQFEVPVLPQPPAKEYVDERSY
jgi:hypothetical protein